MSDIDKITNAELNGKGVRGLPDTPGLTTTDMQNKLDEIAVDVLIPKVNELVENANETNATLGKTDISDIGDGTVTGALDEINSNLQTINQSTKVELLNISNTSHDTQLDLEIPDYDKYNALYVEMYGDANVGGLSLYIPKAMYTENVPFCADTTSYDSTYTLFASGKIYSGHILIRKSIVSGWSKYSIRVLGLK